MANIARPSFIAELSSASEFSSDEMAIHYCDILCTVLNMHAPNSEEGHNSQLLSMVWVNKIWTFHS